MVRKKIISYVILVIILTGTYAQNDIRMYINQYELVPLSADLSQLSRKQKEMLSVFIEVSKIMDEIFWIEAFGDKSQLLDSIEHPALKRLTEFNYGPWERLNGNKPFLNSFGKKPKGANFYPSDMTIEEFHSFEDSTKSSQYTLIRRNPEGNLQSIPYHIAFKEKTKKAATLIQKASMLAEDEGFKKYLSLRAEALLTDDYKTSDMAWMDMQSNSIDFIVGPIENYEDQLFGYKTAHEAFILLKDKSWSLRLNKYVALLPVLQKRLPVAVKYKVESPGINSDLAVYDVIYYAGDCNAGAKSIAINLPNDENLQLEKGSRRLQLKNAMKAKFDKILMPISNELIDESQQKHITFKAFFENVMFHEVAHGLGVKMTIADNKPVRKVIKDQYTTLEEGKADILGLFLIHELKEMGETDFNLMDNYCTFLAGIFRSIRFGSSSAHGKANLIRFNYFKEKEAFIRSRNGKYSVDFKNMQKAVNALSNEIIIIQGDGNYTAAKQMVEKYGVLSKELLEDLERINSKGIPVDVVFEQGPKILGLE